MDIKELTLNWLHEQWVEESRYSEEAQETTDALKVVEHLLDIVEKKED